MSSLRRNEAAKLAANLLNACAGSILTVGVFTPFAVIVYGAVEIRERWALPYLALSCVGLAVLLHGIAQMVLWLMEEAPQ